MGLRNLGNSCYLNSVLQLLWTLPPLAQRYVAPAQNVFLTAPVDPATDFATQACPSYVLEICPHAYAINYSSVPANGTGFNVENHAGQSPTTST